MTFAPTRPLDWRATTAPPNLSLFLPSVLSATFDEAPHVVRKGRDRVGTALSPLHAIDAACSAWRARPGTSGPPSRVSPASGWPIATKWTRIWWREAFGARASDGRRSPTGRLRVSRWWPGAARNGQCHAREYTDIRGGNPWDGGRGNLDGATLGEVAALAEEVIPLVEATVLEGPREGVEGGGGAGHEDEAARLGVEAVHQAGLARGEADARELGVTRHEGVREGATLAGGEGSGGLPRRACRR